MRSRPIASRTRSGRPGRKDFALYLQSLISRFLQVDIHPAAVIGKGIMFDHATGIVIGETAVIGDNCSMLHGVTLGGSGNDRGDRHPKIGRGVMIGAGAKILGNIKIGDCVRVAAGSVVLNDVPAAAHRGRRAGREKSALPAARSRRWPWIRCSWAMTIKTAARTWKQLGGPVMRASGRRR